MRRLWILTKHTYLSFTGDQCTQLSAAISYYVLFSILPLAILTVSIFGFFLDSQEVRNDLVQRVLDVLPLTQTDGRDAVEQVFDNVKSVSGPVALLSLVVTLWSASTVFGSIRKSLNVAWKVEEHRPFVRQKLVDFAQVSLLGALLLTSFALTGFLRTVRRASVDWLGPVGGHNSMWEIPAILLPGLVTFAAFLAVYRIVPARRPRWRDVIPGALFATVAFEALKNGFAFYVAYFNNYNVVYGSLGGLLLFLLFTFIGANILLIGAELSHTLQRYHRREFHDEIWPIVPGLPMTTMALRAVKGLFVREEPS